MTTNDNLAVKAGVIPARQQFSTLKYTAHEDLPCAVCGGTIRAGEQGYKFGNWKGDEPHQWQHLSHLSAHDHGDSEAERVTMNDVPEAARAVKRNDVVKAIDGMLEHVRLRRTFMDERYKVLEIIDRLFERAELAEKLVAQADARASHLPLEIPCWRCKACGCRWRDNLDGTVSLWNAEARSCALCEVDTPKSCEIYWVALRYRLDKCGGCLTLDWEGGEEAMEKGERMESLMGGHGNVRVTKTIKIPKIIWALGDAYVLATNDAPRRPIYYKGQCVGEIHPDYAEPLMAMLLKAKK